MKNTYVRETARFPYSGVAYIGKRRNGRKYVTIVGRNGRSTLRSYAKYVYETRTRKKVPRGMTVDHIDEDCTNDDFRNLQLLSVVANARKSASLRDVTLVRFLCHCGTEFVRRRNCSHIVKGGRLSACCRECAGLVTHLPPRALREAVANNVVSVFKLSSAKWKQEA